MSSGYYFFLSPTVADDLKRMAVREVWYDSYREYRKQKPGKTLTPQQILAEYSQGLYLTGEVGRLWGVTFVSTTKARDTARR